MKGRLQSRKVCRAFAGGLLVSAPRHERPRQRPLRHRQHPHRQAQQARPGPTTPRCYVKCEFMNPGGAIKDRMALHIIEKAEKDGRLKPGGTIVENTSGNTGFGLAMVAAVKGYKCIFTMPDKMSSEKVNRLKAHGRAGGGDADQRAGRRPAQLLRDGQAPGARRRRAPSTRTSTTSPDNIEAHYLTTGPEIWEQMDGKFDYFVAGLGTGGTMSGAGKYLKEKNPKVKNVGVDPIGSVYAGYFKTGKIGHSARLQGRGHRRGHAVRARWTSRWWTRCARSTTGRASSRRGGWRARRASSAAAPRARRCTWRCELAKEVGKGKNIVVVLPDSGYELHLEVLLGRVDARQRLPRGQGAGHGGATCSRTGDAEADQPARKGEKIGEVIETMKQHGISQMPVVDADGTRRGHDPRVRPAQRADRPARCKLTDTIDALIAPLQGVVTPETIDHHAARRSSRRTTWRWCARARR